MLIWLLREFKAIGHGCLSRSIHGCWHNMTYFCWKHCLLQNIICIRNRVKLNQGHLKWKSKFSKYVKENLGHYCGSVISATSGIISMPYKCWFQAWLLLNSGQLWDDVSRRRQKMTQVLGSLTTRWDAQLGLQASGFNLAHSSHCGHLGIEPMDTRSVSNSA